TTRTATRTAPSPVPGRPAAQLDRAMPPRAGASAPRSTGGRWAESAPDRAHATAAVADRGALPSAAAAARAGRSDAPGPLRLRASRNPTGTPPLSGRGAHRRAPAA